MVNNCNLLHIFTFTKFNQVLFNYKWLIKNRRCLGGGESVFLTNEGSKYDLICNGMTDNRGRMFI